MMTAGLKGPNPKIPAREARIEPSILAFPLLFPKYFKFPFLLPVFPNGTKRTKDRRAPKKTMIKHLFLIFAALLTLTGCASGQKEIDALADEIYQNHRLKPPLPPRPFVSDGCSCWPDSDWLKCCVEHDLFYWTAGPDETDWKPTVC
jgi:hypothetical protein